MLFKRNRHIRYLSYTLCTVLFSLLFTSCVDDLGYKDENIVPGEEFTGITLVLPNVKYAADYGATRTDEGMVSALEDSREGNFNTLYVVAVKDDGKVYISLKTQPNAVVEEIYNQYFISLPVGNYKFYVVANMNRYILDNDGNNITFYEKVSKEDEIRNLILNFSYDRPLEPGFLPMACLAENIKVGPDKANAVTASSNNTTYFKGDYVKIVKGEGRNRHVYADLDFLCSKVRYTILFDRAEAKKTGFGDNDVIDVHRSSHEVYPYATNIRKQTAIFSASGPENSNVDFSEDFITEANSTENKLAEWPIDLGRVVYNPETFNFYTARNESAEDKENIIAALKALQPWNSSNGNWTTEFKDKRAWQGVAYLPENLLEDNPTLLEFPYSFNGVEGANSPREIKLDWIHTDNSKGIKRSTVYDVYALIKTADPQGWTVDIVPQDWTLQELVYQLHGPYELIVETSEIENLSMDSDVQLWFRTDVPIGDVVFESPQVSSTGTTGDNMVPLFVGGVVRDDAGNYVMNEKGDYLMSVGMNLDIPYRILKDLNENGIQSKDQQGNDVTFKIEDISYFHIVAGSLHKRINIKHLDVDPYLTVDPQVILIDTREYFTSGLDNPVIEVEFETNVDLSDSGVSLTLADPSNLVSSGISESNVVVMKFDKPSYVTGNSSPYTITSKKGVLKLSLKNIISGNPFWNKSGEYKVTFTLKVPGSGTNGDEDLVIERPVTIKIKPFTGTYTIHFRDNTKSWNSPHIFVYQDLTLPADMVKEDGSPYELAGKIVGYIEENPTSGLQWNAAVQYVFTNSVAFKGWYGNHKQGEDGNEYGGPYFAKGDRRLNDPWAPAMRNNWAPDDKDNRNANKSTMGFVMFYREDNPDLYDIVNDDKGIPRYFWNYDYAYNTTYQLKENPYRKDKYYYDINFNGDHEGNSGKWVCDICRRMADTGNYNYVDGEDRFYTGIAMEPDPVGDGWWKYTLTGVAQPGRTMIIFANYHKPWDMPLRDFQAEDNRWPGDYESGLPLFDFEDNDGWFLFDGNTINRDQRFSDEKPETTPHDFSNMRNLRIEVKKTASVNQVPTIQIGSRSTTGILNDNKYYADLSNLSFSAQDTTITVKINNRDYVVSPKYFKRSGSQYVTATPLLLEYDSSVELYVKWNDAVGWQSWWDNWIIKYYKNSDGNGTIYPNDWLSVYLNNNKSGTPVYSELWNGQTIGNYKYKRIPFSDYSIQPGVQAVSLGLGKTKNSSDFYKVIKVEDLPKYYYPTENNYLINWNVVAPPSN